MDYFQFKTKELRDLAWVIRSPFMIFDEQLSLEDGFCEHEFNNMLPLLQKLDQNPSDLFSHLGELRSPYLGHYYEKLVQFWLMHSEDIELVANNIQLVENGNTLGEIDFIVKRNNRYEHWEVAVKFYLGYEHEIWIGPNPVDRLDLKLNRMFSHQLKMTETEAGKRLLQKLGIDELDRKCLVKGYLYYPLNKEFAAPQVSSVFHARSWWTYHKSLNYPMKDLFLARKEKRDWLSPSIFKEEDLIRQEQLIQKLSSRKNRKPQLFAFLKKEGAHYYEEFSSFISLDNWPDKI